PIGPEPGSKSRLPAFVRTFLAKPFGRGLIFALILIVMSVVSIMLVFPVRITPASAPADRFSAERAMAHLPIIAREAHPSGSPAQARVRDYLLETLSAMGVRTEVQRTRGIENVIAYLPGKAPTGAILVLTHYDSVPAGPGAADNGSGVAALLEAMRALAAGPAPRNDLIVLFDDGEEIGPGGPFTGTRAFISEHPRMTDVKVAISLDTAVNGPISTNETGPDNGWMVQALARAFTGGAWTSLSGGGDYDYSRFREAGIQGLALEANYPFKEQHTPFDLPEVVRPASVQQMGEQTLAIVRELGGLDLSNPQGEKEIWFTLPVLGFFHYPQAWTLPLAITAGLLLALAIGLALWRGFASWRGLVIGLGASLGAAAISAVGIGALWSRVPGLTGWKTSAWPEWPELIPPYGGLVFGVFGLLVLGLTVAVYVLARRRSGRPDFSLAGLVPFFVLAVAVAVGAPRGAYFSIWPVLAGSVVWIVAAFMGGSRRAWTVDLAALLTAALLILFVLPLLPGVFMSDGFKSIMILAAVWALVLAIVLPAVDGRPAQTAVRNGRG
ncbi:MAG TPA: M20/M25/M40 family metallo-hydrolase, partial [Candidatus Sulfotelmatobacter sp.]|nr:M20/M25/M40 family metallo-hydrolase [Candidatus Sulfotelmatobacter sp.]